MSKTLTSQLLDLASQAPDRECLHLLYQEQPEIALTRQQLVNHIRGAAQQLHEAGVRQGDLVIIIQRDLLTLVSTFFGVSFLGAIPSILPFATEKLDPIRYRASMAALLELSQPPYLAVDALVKADVEALLPEDSANLPKLLVIQQSNDQTAQAQEVSADEIALLQHSSGTTGLQKGVALSHRAIFDQLEAYSSTLGFTANDVIVSWLPLYHDMGLIAGFLMPLLSGAKLVLMSPFEWVRAPHILLHAITKHRGTFCWLPNFAYNFCAQKIRENDLAGIDLSSIRAFVNCSEPAYEASHKLFAERFTPYGIDLSKLTVCYAMAETVFAVSQTPAGQVVPTDEVDRVSLRRDNLANPPISDSPSERILSCGAPIPDMHVKIVDQETRADLVDRHVGEIAVRSPYMLTGYYHRTDATDAAFHDGWYLTGDLGYTADGQVYVLGRKKDLLIVGGRNIYPQDVEALASMIEGVHPGRVAVFGIANPQAGTEDAALVAEVDTEDEEAQSVIKANIRRVVAGGSDITLRYIWLVPRGWLIKTSSGKVARSANREKILAENSVPA